MKLSSIGILVLLLSIGLLLFTAFRGLAFPDEGYILNTAQRLADGQLLYKDFDFVYTPLTALATLLSFKIGISVLSERIIALLLSLLTIYLLLRFTKLVTPNPLLQLIPTILYIVWGPSHINFIWPGMWAVDLAIIANCLLFEAIQEKKIVPAFLSGVFFSLVILTKQNYAASVFLEIIALFIFSQNFRRKNSFLPVLLGVLIPLLSFLSYLLITSSLTAFAMNFYSNIIDQIVVKGSINTPLPYGSSPFTTFLKLLFYFSPLLLSLFSLLVFWKKEKNYLPFLLMTIFFFLLGFRPVSDYVHLTPLLSLNGIPLFLLIVHRNTIQLPFIKSSRNSSNTVIMQAFLKSVLYGILIILSILGVWSSLFFGYYRWSPPLITQSSFITNSRVNIWVDSQTKQKIETLTSLLNTYSNPHEEVFLNYYAPMVYFLADRRNPTRYDYTGLTRAAQNDLTATLERKKIQTIITFALNSSDQTPIGVYIQKHYFLKKVEGEYSVWKRRT